MLRAFCTSAGAARLRLVVNVEFWCVSLPKETMQLAIPL